MNKPTHIISLGAGVQSSTMALMAAHGEIEPMPECAIFADTKNEPAAVYEWLDWLEQQLPFPVVRVSQGDLREEQLTARMRGKKDDEGGRWASIPYYTLSLEDGQKGMVRRQCTSEYKIQPIERYMKREMLGLKPRQRSPKEPVIVQWRGISVDEAQRMKPSRERWYSVRYPLAMEHQMRRSDCKAWLWRNFKRVSPRSACKVCPFHSDAEWRDMKIYRPEEFNETVEFDHAIRKAGGTKGDTYLHRSCKPLDEVDFDNAEDRGQVDAFGEECEGMCGL